jgi:hypothetical protein
MDSLKIKVYMWFIEAYGFIKPMIRVTLLIMGVHTIITVKVQSFGSGITGNTELPSYH